MVIPGKIRGRPGLPHSANFRADIDLFAGGGGRFQSGHAAPATDKVQVFLHCVREKPRHRRVNVAVSVSALLFDEHLERVVYLNGAFVKGGEAKISIFDRGLLFADQVKPNRLSGLAVLEGSLDRSG